MDLDKIIIILDGKSPYSRIFLYYISFFFTRISARLVFVCAFPCHIRLIRPVRAAVDKIFLVVFREM